MKTFKIYKATNEAGKSYIGYTGESFDTRRNRHLAHARKGSKHYFHRGLNKHKFVWEVLAETKDKDDATYLERYFIALHNTKLPNGYNMTDGGEGAPGLKRDPKQFDSRRGRRIMSGEFHVKMLENWQVGVIRSDLRMYSSITAAALDSKTSPGNIVRVLKGKSLIAGGFGWTRLDGKDDLIKLAKHAELKLRKAKQYKQVIDQFGNEFKSITECATHYKTTASNIARVCNKVNRTFKGIEFNFKETG